MDRVINAKTVRELLDVYLELYEEGAFQEIPMEEYERAVELIESRLVLDCNVDLTPYSEGDREAQ